MPYIALTIALLCPSSIAAAQTPAGGIAAASVDPAWSFRASAATYFFPDDADYVQPTLTADHKALHFEARYNYEDQHAMSGLIGRTFEFGRGVTFEVTPMLGGVVGETQGVIPAVSLALAFGRFEASSESEYVIDLNQSRDSFFYSWSEFSGRLTDWLRAGVVIQRTRQSRRPRDVQRGLLAGIEAGPIDGAFYVFNPGSSDRFFVASIGVSF